MPEFAYVARDPSGEKVTGVIDAANRREVLAALAARSLFPVQVRGESPVADRQRVGRVPAQLMAAFYAQLADLLASGVPLLRALEVLRKQASHRVLNAVLEQVHRRVEDGATLGDAMARFESVFGEMAVSMVRAGGEGGFLEEALSRVAEFTEIQEDLRKRTFGAMAYPMVLAAVGVIVVTVLMVFFVPKFEPLFDNLRRRNELPVVTEALLAVSGMFQRWGWIAIGGAAVSAWLTRRWLRTEPGRWWRDQTKLRLPIVGHIFRNLAVARFCRVLGTLLRNGVPIIRALEISSQATGNRVLGAAIQEATENITAGQPLAEPLAECEHFPATVVEMIAVAEQSNTLEKVLLNIANSLERNTWRQLDLAVRLLEPIMLMLLAGVVLVLVIALLFPVLKMSTAIG